MYGGAVRKTASGIRSLVRYVRAQGGVTKGDSLSLSLFKAREENEERLSSFRRGASASSAGVSFRTNICHSTHTTTE